MVNADLFPMPLAWRDCLILSKSVLSNLLIVWGREERIQHLDLGPLEVNELMPEAHLFNQSPVGDSIVVREPCEDIVPSAPELDQTTDQEEEEQEQEKVVIPPAKVFSSLSPGSLLWSSFLSSCILAPWGALWRLIDDLYVY